MRQLVSYDDLATPAPPSSGPSASSSGLPYGPSASKKRKQDDTRAADMPPAKKQHAAKIKVEEESSDDEADDGEMSRYLTQEEIWDDSALIKAWDAANAEYEAYHGPDKGWKKTPVDSSPLWYNVPPKASKKKKKKRNAQKQVEFVEPNTHEEDSTPVNFDTFVPTHDASLANPEPLDDQYEGYPPNPLGDMPAAGGDLSKDETFNRAMGAMYWTGYWTAMYHMKSREQNNQVSSTHEKDDMLEDEDSSGVLAEEDSADNEFISSQR